MPGDREFPTYRHQPKPNAGRQSAPFGFVLLAMVMGIVQMVRSGAPLWVPLLIIALTMLLGWPLIAIPKRRITVTDRDYLTVQGPLGMRRTAWRDIRAIEIQRHWNGAESAAAYDRDGRKIELPHVNSWSVPDLHTEVSVLRDHWTRLRGEDWTEDPAQREE